MLSGAVTNRYTQGFYAMADEHGVVEAVDRSLTLLADAISANPELKSLVEHPLISTDVKVKAISGIFDQNLDPVVYRFLHILFARGRSGYVVSIARRFHQLALDAEGRVSVSIESANPLSEEATKSLTDQLSTVLNKKVDAVVEVKPELIAGYRIKVGNRVLDATILGALTQFRDKLATASSGKEGTR
jgi:F-type H+-transporting ATPase subunit delta